MLKKEPEKGNYPLPFTVILIDCLADFAVNETNTEEVAENMQVRARAYGESFRHAKNTRDGRTYRGWAGQARNMLLPSFNKGLQIMFTMISISGMLIIQESKIIRRSVMPDTMLVKVSSKGLVTLPKKIRSRLGIEEGDYLSISSDKDRIILRKAKIDIDYENSDEAWNIYSKRKLADD